MKKTISVLLVLVMLFALCVNTGAYEKLTDHICFTWAWNANRIDTDNSVSVVSWSGGSYSSYRSSFIVYDLPEDFKYERGKSEVLITFAIGSTKLNNPDSEPPTAAVVLVDGDKVKEAYSLKSGAAATALLNEAKQSGVFFGNYKITKYPRPNLIKDANANSFFEKNPNVKSLGFYVTNLASDGYSGVKGGIATAMTDFEVRFTAYNNYTNATVNMVDDKGNVLDTITVRDEIGAVIDVPKTIEKSGIIWVRDEGDYILSEDTDIVTVTYHDDKGDREKYVKIIEDEVSAKVEGEVAEELDLPTQILCEDGFVIDIEWFSSDESVVDSNGSVYQGMDIQTAELYAKVWIGEYTSVETKKFTVTVAPVNEGETEESLLCREDFSIYEDLRGSFEGTETAVDAVVGDEFTISAFVRVDDLSKGGTIFNVSGVKCEVNDGALNLEEGQWCHIALTNSALYINGDKVGDVNSVPTGEESYIGAYWGKMDNFCVYGKAFSQSVINSLMEEGYDSPEVEIVSASVIEGLDGVLVRVNSHGYEGTGVVTAFADVGGVRHSGYCEKKITEGVNVFSINVPNMGGGLTKDNTSVLLWNGMEGMEPLTDEFIADRKYDFGFDYAHPDNHMLNNTFTLMDADTGLYLSENGLSQRTDDGEWTAAYRNGVNKEGYYSLVNQNGKAIDGNFTFEQVEGNIYRIRDCDAGEYISYGGNDEWMLSITEYDDVSKVFASEGFMLLSENERERLYGVTAQALQQSYARREKLCEIIDNGYFDLEGESQAEKLREIFTYYPAYQINRAVNKSTTGVEAVYTLSAMKWTNYEDMDGNSRSGYSATAVYDYDEGDVTVSIYARSQNVVRNIAKGFSYMPYQFIRPLTRVVDYNASNNQFKAETGLIYIETNYEVSAENVAVTGAHELGHLIDFAGYRMSMGDYRTAYKETDVNILSGYGDTALNEDFAEFCQFIISCSGDKEKLRQLKKMYPGRFDAVCEGMCEMYGECILK